MPEPTKTLVMKFGGTSVGTVDAMAQAVRIICDAHRDWPGLVVVTSALSGVTNLLIDSATRAARGDMTVYHQAVSELTSRHREIIEQLITNPARKHQIHWEIKHLIGDFSNLCQAINVLGEASPRALDAVAALGERLAVRILAAAVESTGQPAEYIESTHLVLTDDQFTNAVPDMLATTARTRQALLPMLAAGRIPIITGYIAAAPSGATTTLGRGGSDYSASILAVALQAGEVWIWTDVDGVMTADPRMIPNARTIPELSYREVAEMAHFGAKVLHPKSIHPVIEAGIDLRVRNTFNPSGPDTRLVAECCIDHYGMIRAITTIRGLQLVTLSGRGMLGVPGVAGRIFSAVATTGVSVPLIIESTSEQAICFPAPKELVPLVIQTIQSHLSHDFHRGDSDRVFPSEEVDIITVISPGLRTTPGVAGQIFGILGSAGINVLGISFGASDVSINLIVSARDTQAAVRALHTLVP
ncbi:MAG: aspartate kinase [Chloroflexi bacterium]|nr:MAG: aspartate kinase [Chloroflexota bacterium]